jgi:hypothetical protein
LAIDPIAREEVCHAAGFPIILELVPSSEDGQSNIPTSSLMNDAERYKLLHGPYKAPRVRYGKTLFCELRGEVTVDAMSAGRIAWPMDTEGTPAARVHPMRRLSERCAEGICNSNLSLVGYNSANCDEVEKGT